MPRKSVEGQVTKSLTTTGSESKNAHGTVNDEFPVEPSTDSEKADSTSVAEPLEEESESGTETASPSSYSWH